MSLVFNMVGGGSGGGSGPSSSDAILTVTVPTGSTVTMTKGGVTLTPTMWVQAADPTLDCALFVIPASMFDSQSAWTVTATDGTNTASETVLITTNKYYEVTLYFYWYIFNNGIMESAISGGMQATKIYGDTGTYSLEIVNVNLVAKARWTSGNNGISVWYRTANQIDLSDYSALKVKISSAINPANRQMVIGVNPTNPSGNIWSWNLLAYTQFSAVNTETTFTVDISAINQLCYVGIGGFSGSEGELEIVMPQIWLEP